MERQRRGAERAGAGDAAAAEAEIEIGKSQRRAAPRQQQGLAQAQRHFAQRAGEPRQPQLDAARVDRGIGAGAEGEILDDPAMRLAGEREAPRPGERAAEPQACKARRPRRRRIDLQLGAAGRLRQHVGERRRRLQPLHGGAAETERMAVEAKLDRLALAGGKPRLEFGAAAERRAGERRPGLEVGRGGVERALEREPVEPQREIALDPCRRRGKPDLAEMQRSRRRAARRPRRCRRGRRRGIWRRDGLRAARDRADRVAPRHGRAAPCRR